MSALGIVMLVHTALHRSAQVARFWADGGCPVVIHVDRSVKDAERQSFEKSLDDLPNVNVLSNHTCEWGTWNLVAATQDASMHLLRNYPEVRHVYLTSGSCLPIKPVSQLAAYLAERPETDFIESVSTKDMPWTVGGLNDERFTLWFPLSWRQNRRLFDASVKVQRKLKVQRALPAKIQPHLGSQWWCLTRRTLSAILEDPKRRTFDSFFKRVWIPDEAYFQTLARLWSGNIESRSLTYSKFDFQGKPHVLYDDHLPYLANNPCFVARKVWPGADMLYNRFLDKAAAVSTVTKPAHRSLNELFDEAKVRRTRGRPGLSMQSRFPDRGWDRTPTANTYNVFQGLPILIPDFEEWIGRHMSTPIHGRLFAPDRVHYSGGGDVGPGGLSNCGAIRDANPKAFLGNLLWNTRGTPQSFLFGPKDRQAIVPELARDPNATIYLVSGAWLVPLARGNKNFSAVRDQAARLQRIEDAQLAMLRRASCNATVHIWTLAEFVAAPMTVLHMVSGKSQEDMALTEVPELADVSGVPRLLRNLKNQGVPVHLAGDLPQEPLVPDRELGARKPYLVPKS